jgi:hypothetical protein
MILDETHAGSHLRYVPQTLLGGQGAHHLEVGADDRPREV